jgi:predicted SAM-dependent methyltransferase
MSNPYPQPPETPARGDTDVRRMNWGSGDWADPGWINSDLKDGPGVDIACDIRDGLPLETSSLDYIVSHHALVEIPMSEIVPVLKELRRVLKTGGILRLGLPNLDNAIKAYQQNDRDYFLIPDEDATTIGGKFVTQVLWYGYTRTLFTQEFTEEMLLKAGFREVVACEFGETESQHPGIVELDTRERESLFVEATK